MIICVSKSASPITKATHKQFGDAVAHPPHMGEYTLKQIYKMGQATDPWNLECFQKMVEVANLSRVHHPFWRDWFYAEPSIVLI